MFPLRNIPRGEERPLFSQANSRVRSIWKSGFRFKNPDFGFAIERDFKTDSNAEISVFRFSSLPFNWEIRKTIWKTFLKNSGLDLVHDNSFANPFALKSAFGFLNWNPPRGRISPFSDFAFDCKIRNPHFQSKSVFSSRAQPLMYFTSTYGHCIHESKQCCYLKTTTQQ